MSQWEVVFTREGICKAFDTSRNSFYILVHASGNQLKKAGDKIWACDIYEMREFIKNLPGGDPACHEK